jgi:hypothetical protein
MRRATAVEVRLDASEGALSSALAKSTGRFDRLGRTRSDLPLAKTPEAAIWALQQLGIG